MRTFINSYDVAQRVNGNKGVSQTNIDVEETESEWKLFQRVIFVCVQTSVKTTCIFL